MTAWCRRFHDGPVVQGQRQPIRSNRKNRGAARWLIRPPRLSPWVLGLLVAVSLQLADHASAQTTRAEEQRAQREAKSRELRPHKRSTVEAVLFKIEDDLLVERILAPPRGIHARLGQIGEGAGFGGGPDYQLKTFRFDLRASAAASVRGYFIAEGAARFPGTLGEDLYTWKNGPYVELYARRRDFPQEDFYGLGPDSLEENRSDFALRDTFGQVTGGFRQGHLTAGVNAGYLDPSVGAGTDDRYPSTAEIFGPAGVPGLAQQPAFAVLQPFLEFATLDRALNDQSGGHYRVSFSYFSDRDLDQFSFRRFDVDLRQYIPFFQSTRTIALRAWLAATDASGGNVVPFYLQPTLGGAYSLRGFRSFRFRDETVALVQAEYRWRINEFVTGAFFFDTGAVGPGLDDLGKLERDYGFGLRAGSRTTIAFRADVAFGGREGTRFLVRFDDAF